MIEPKIRTRRQWLRLSLAMPLVALGACETTGTGPQLEDDSVLSERVRAALEASGQTGNQGILVSTRDNGFIRLSGRVDNDAVRQEAERIATGVDGVNGVINTLELNN